MDGWLLVGWGFYSYSCSKNDLLPNFLTMLFFPKNWYVTQKKNLNFEFRISFLIWNVVQAVSEQGAAWAAGLRAGDLITQLNGESVQGLLHTQVTHKQAVKKSETRPRGGVFFYIYLACVLIHGVGELHIKCY